MTSEIRYWIVASLGGGNAMTYRDLFLVSNRQSWRTSQSNFDKWLKVSIEYGLIKQNKPSSQKNSPDVKYQITDRGGEALECYKKMRYFGTKEEYKLRDDHVSVEAQVPAMSKGNRFNGQTHKKYRHLN